MTDRPHTPIGRRGLLGAGATVGALALFARNTGTAQAVEQPRSVTVVDVRAQGALGDATTDDTAAFRTAFDLISKAGGGIVFVPNGTYRVHGLELPVSCTLRGESIASVLQAPPQSTRPAVLTVAAARVTVENLTVDGNAPQQQAACNGVNIDRGATDTRLRDVRIRRAANHGVSVTPGAATVRIEGCTIETNGLNGVTATGANDVSILGNLLLDNGRSAIHLLAGSGTAAHLSVVANVVRGAGGLVPGVAAIRVDDGCREVVVSANTVSATAPGAAGIIAAGPSARPVEAVTVTENLVADVGGDAIVVAGKGVVATGNSVRGGAGAGIVATGDGVAVVANTIRGCARSGVRVLAATGVLVVGNALCDTGDGDDATEQDAALAVLASPVGARGLLVANTISGTTDAAAMHLGDARAFSIGAGSSAGPTTGAPVATSGVDRAVSPTRRLGTLTVGATPQAFPHGCPSVPSNVVITMHSEGSVWLAATPGATDLELCADGDDRVCEVRVG